MEHAIAITRSQLQQVIEDYVAASRVGDTLSYVETARLSTAEAAESSTSRIWDALHTLDKVTVFHDLDQGVANPVVHDLAEEALQSQEFTCVEGLRAGQVVIVNSRGMIEGKRDETDQAVTSDKPVVSYDFGFFQAEQLHCMFCSNTDATVRVDFMPDGKVTAWDHSPDVAPIELTDTVDESPGNPDDFF